jgi:hypothetical protein
MDEVHFLFERYDIFARIMHGQFHISRQFHGGAGSHTQLSVEDIESIDKVLSNISDKYDANKDDEDDDDNKKSEIHDELCSLRDDLRLIQKDLGEIRKMQAIYLKKIEEYEKTSPILMLGTCLYRKKPCLFRQILFMYMQASSIYRPIPYLCPDKLCIYHDTVDHIVTMTRIVKRLQILLQNISGLSKKDISLIVESKKIIIDNLTVIIRMP